MKNEKKKLKPKQYTHIDYEALLIYIMREHISLPRALSMLDLDIAKSTVTRNLNSMKKQDVSTYIIDLYQNEYIPNMQKEKLPEKIQYKIDALEVKPVIVKAELQDLYNKLTYMKNIVESCNGNIAEAARLISSGKTILGDVEISTQGLSKNLKRYEVVNEELKKQRNEKEGEEK